MLCKRPRHIRRAALLMSIALPALACGGGAQSGVIDPHRVAHLASDIVMERVHGSRTTATPNIRSAAAPATDATALSEAARYFSGVERFVVPLEDAPSRGPQDALVTIVEISDFQCPFCGRVAPTVEQLLTEYPDEVRVVFRHNPLPFHHDARPAAIASLEARRQGGDDAFWRMHDLLFANQRALDRTSLERFAADIGLDVAEVGHAIDTDRYRDIIDEDRALATRLEARGTPSFFLNGRPLHGARPLEAFREIVEDELRRARSAMTAGLPRRDVYAAATLGAPDRPAPPTVAAAPTRAVPDPDAVYRVPVTNEPSRGPADALVTIVVLSDFQCPFCSRVVPTIEQILAQYGNDVRLVWMNNPLPFHHDALPAAYLALEAFRQRGDRGFWEAHDLLFANQGALDRSDLERYARRLHLNIGQVKRALDGTRHQASIDAHQALAQSLGATGTPSFFINGRNLRGAQPIDAFRALIDEELRKARELVANGTPRARVYEETIRNGATTPRTTAAAALMPPAAAPPPSVYTIAVPANAPSRGPANARVTIQLFSDFQCPFCGRARPIVDQILAAYPSDVRVVWRNYPLPFHNDALPTAEAAMEVFAQGGATKFWAFHDLAFDNQRALTRQSFETWARQVGGIDMARFARALDQHAHQARIQEDMDAVRRAGAQIGTPSFFINGTLLQGAQPFERFRDAIDAELGRTP